MREAIYRVLNDGLPDLNGKIYPLTVPQDTKADAVIYKVIGTVDTTGITCNTPVTTRFGVQIDVLTSDYGEGTDIADSIRTLLREEFITSNNFNFESYENITKKYRQVIDIHLELKM